MAAWEKGEYSNMGLSWSFLGSASGTCSEVFATRPAITGTWDPTGRVAKSPAAHSKRWVDVSGGRVGKGVRVEARRIRGVVPEGKSSKSGHIAVPGTSPAGIQERTALETFFGRVGAGLPLGKGARPRVGAAVKFP